MFRFFFLGGMVKILSADPGWDSLTALAFHFETQPLPTVAAWYAHHLPRPVLMSMTAATLIIELVLPFLVFAPRRLRMLAAWSFIVLQGMILLTGNYNFFNLLALALCLFLFDDAALARFAPRAVRPQPASGRVAGALTWVFAALVLFASGELLWRALTREHGTAPTPVTAALTSCRCVSNYGPFAVMTTVRHEIEIEGSLDGNAWQSYAFRYKPGPVHRLGGWIIPHQPRLDWQMWFAALSRPGREPWFHSLLVRLLQGSAPVTALFAENPFPRESPRWIRARFYRYRYATPEQRSATGNWWVREPAGDYFPPARLP